MTSQPRALYGRHGEAYFLKLVGEIRYTLAPNVEAFLDDLFERHDFDDIIVDLRGTSIIDSTGLGLVARIGSFMRREHNRPATIVCDRDDVWTSLTAVGFDRVFTLTDTHEDPPCAFRDVPTAPRGHRELMTNVLAAHHALMDIDEGNVRAFRDVVIALERELASEASNAS